MHEQQISQPADSQDPAKAPTTPHIYTLRNAAGVEARITNYGGIVLSLKVPDRHGALGDVVLGHDKIEDYGPATPYFGCLVGRYANRIANARFTLGEREFSLVPNDGANCLHGGAKGFDKALWSARQFHGPHGPALELKHHSPDGDEGFPGNLDVTAVYSLTDDNSLRIEFGATTDKATVVSLTHHSYFNLAGGDDVLDHEVFLKASRFTPVNASMIPSGELRPVAGTPFDFTRATTIGARMRVQDEQLALAKGYDHNWILDKAPGELGLAARVTERLSGRVLEVLTTNPGIQFYTGNFLDGTITGKAGRVYSQHSGFCLEPQHYPDSPNQPMFPSATLNPGEIYRNTILYRFSVEL